MTLEPFGAQAFAFYAEREAVAAEMPAGALIAHERVYAVRDALEHPFARGCREDVVDELEADNAPVDDDVALVWIAVEQPTCLGEEAGFLRDAGERVDAPIVYPVAFGADVLQHADSPVQPVEELDGLACVAVSVELEVRDGLALRQAVCEAFPVGVPGEFRIVDGAAHEAIGRAYMRQDACGFVEVANRALGVDDHNGAVVAVESLAIRLQ